MNIGAKLSTYISPSIYGHIQDAAKLAQDRKQPLVLVGGVVRDVLLGRTNLDADIMLEPPVQSLIDAWVKGKKADVITHERFMTFTVSFGPGEKIDVVTAREEKYPRPGHLPQVTVSTIPNDLKRRDFTVNAIACWLTKDQYGELLDPFSGRGDLENKVIRALHSASFVDDPTRIYRAARIAGRLGFEVEAKTAGWIQKAISEKTPEVLSPVRRRHEFELILKEDDPWRALAFLEKWGALSCIHPEWKRISENLMAHYSRKAPAQASLLTWRLALWFKPWGNEKALKMMTDLAFEKDVKREVLALL